jgi:IclR family pca regulon transcriptional regulator
VLRFSGSYLASARLPRVMQPTLNRLAAQTQQSFSAVVLEGDGGHRGAKRRLWLAQPPAGLWTAPGRAPARARHLGRVLLAALAPAELVTGSRAAAWRA